MTPSSRNASSHTCNPPPNPPTNLSEGVESGELVGGIVSHLGACQGGQVVGVHAVSGRYGGCSGRACCQRAGLGVRTEHVPRRDVG